MRDLQTADLSTGNATAADLTPVLIWTADRGKRNTGRASTVEGQALVPIDLEAMIVARDQGIMSIGEAKAPDVIEIVIGTVTEIARETGRETVIEIETGSVKRTGTGIETAIGTEIEIVAVTETGIVILRRRRKEKRR